MLILVIMQALLAFRTLSSHICLWSFRVLLQFFCVPKLCIVEVQSSRHIPLWLLLCFTVWMPLEAMLCIMITCTPIFILSTKAFSACIWTENAFKRKMSSEIVSYRSETVRLLHCSFWPGDFLTLQRTSIVFFVQLVTLFSRPAQLTVCCSVLHWVLLKITWWLDACCTSVCFLSTGLPLCQEL